MRNIHWQNGSTRVQGWLMLPKGFVPGKTYPLVVSVHGGPSLACTFLDLDEGFSWSRIGTGLLRSRPSPRGSYGQGEAFTQANIKDFGGGDYRDIMAGIHVFKEYPIDPKRIGLRGTAMANTSPCGPRPRPAAFCRGGCALVFHRLSYYGLNDIDEWMIPFLSVRYTIYPAVYAKELQCTSSKRSRRLP